MSSADVAEEVRRRRTAPYELDVQIRRADADVAEEPTEAVDVVEPRVGLELHRCAVRRQPLQLAESLTRVALALSELRRVDLHQPYARAARELERVAVPDPVDGRRRARRRLRSLRAAGDAPDRECGRNRQGRW